MALATVCKLLLVIINTIFLVVSIALIAVGVILVYMVDTFLKSAFESAKDSAATSGYIIDGDAGQLDNFPLLKEIGVALLVFGVALFALSIMGYMGSCCTTCCRMMLLVYAVILIALALAQVVVFSLFLTKDSELHKSLKKEVQKKITSDYDENSGNAFTAAIIIINREGDCCGMEGVQDFGQKQHQSCEAQYETKGCYDEMQDQIQDNKVYAGLALGAMLALQLIEIIAAIVVFKDAKWKISPF